MSHKNALLVLLGIVLFLQRDAIAAWWAMTNDQWIKYDKLFEKYGLEFGVNPAHLKAFALNESLLGLHPSVAQGLRYPHDVEGSKSSDGLSWGLMQVTLKTGADWDKSITPEKLNIPEYSIRIAAQEIARLQKSFNKSDSRYWEYVVKSYNQGMGNTQKREINGVEPVKEVVNEYWARWLRNLARAQSDDVGVN